MVKVLKRKPISKNLGHIQIFLTGLAATPVMPKKRPALIDRHDYDRHAERIAMNAPTMCISCGSDKFRWIMRPGRPSIRYLCSDCEHGYYQSKPDAMKSNIMQAGFIMDNAVLDISSRESVSRLYADIGGNMSHTRIFDVLCDNLPVIETYTNDVMCTLKYGNVWSVDETSINIRGTVGKPDREIMREFKRKWNHVKKSNPETYRKEWEKARIREIKSQENTKNIYLTGILDWDTRVIIAHVVTESRPKRRILYNLFREAVTVSGTPSEIITDKYPAYVKAVARLKRTYNSRIMHTQIRAGDKSTLRLRVSKADRKKGSYTHNNIIEAAWSRLKRNMTGMKSMDINNARMLIKYHIIHNNFIRPHAGMGNTDVIRHDVRKQINNTPVMKAGFIWFSKFAEILIASNLYHKSFLSMIDHETLRHFNIVSHGSNITLTAKPKTPKAVIKKNDGILQMHCNFGLDRMNDGTFRWTRKILPMSPSGRSHGMNIGMAGRVQTFKICRNCGRVATTPQGIQFMMGYTINNNRYVAQSFCRECLKKSVKSSE